jgi:hypothetical protein
MCSPIPWYWNASEEGNPKKVKSNTKGPRKKQEGGEGRHPTLKNQTKGPYNIIQNSMIWRK